MNQLSQGNTFILIAKGIILIVCVSTKWEYGLLTCRNH